MTPEEIAQLITEDASTGFGTRSKPELDNEFDSELNNEFSRGDRWQSRLPHDSESDDELKMPETDLPQDEEIDPVENDPKVQSEKARIKEKEAELARAGEALESMRAERSEQEKIVSTASLQNELDDSQKDLIRDAMKVMQGKLAQRTKNGQPPDAGDALILNALKTALRWGASRVCPHCGQGGDIEGGLEEFRK